MIGALKDGNLAEAEDVKRMEEAVRKLDAVHPSGNKRILDIPVLMQVIVGTAKMPLSEIMKLKPGSVVVLDRDMGEPVSISIGGKTIALAQIVVCEGDNPKLGVSIIETKQPDSMNPDS